MADRQQEQSFRSQLINLAGDSRPLMEAAHTWFLQQGPSMADTLTQALDDEGLGSVGHWRILRLLQTFARKETLPAILRTLQRARQRRDPTVLSAAMEAAASFRAPA